MLDDNRRGISSNLPSKTRFASYLFSRLAQQTMAGNPTVYLDGAGSWPIDVNEIVSLSSANTLHDINPRWLWAVVA
jgi:hypothetical protein